MSRQVTCEIFPGQSYRQINYTYVFMRHVKNVDFVDLII